MTERRLPALLWDMDGTILDSIELIVESAVYAFDGRDGPRPTRAEWQALIGTSLDSMLARWATSTNDAVFLKARYRQFQVDNHDRFVRLYPGVEDVLRECHARGHPMAIVSSKLDAGIRRSMDYFKLTPLFEFLVGIESTTNHKPHPEPVFFALDKLGVAAPDALFIGDSPHDADAARAAGVPMAAVTWGAYSRDEIAPSSPTHWLERATDLRTLLLH
jgi:pyrophosphatase PpaX